MLWLNMCFWSERHNVWKWNEDYGVVLHYIGVIGVWPRLGLFGILLCCVLMALTQVMKTGECHYNVRGMPQSRKKKRSDMNVGLCWLRLPVSWNYIKISLRDLMYSNCRTPTHSIQHSEQSSSLSSLEAWERPMATLTDFQRFPFASVV